MGEIEHLEAHFTGRVQGVGFRYAVMEVAREFEVAGYVENLPDGRVRVEAEGVRADLERLVAAIEAKMQGHIRKTDTLFRMRHRQFAGFVIR